MKKVDAIKMIEGGVPIVFVEYRSSKAELIQYRDKETKKAMELRVLRHTVEAGDTTIGVNERVKDDFDVIGFKPPFSKGTRCLLRLSALQTTKGVTTASGTLEALEV